MYQVLYRKWRPASFEDVIGQNHVTQALKNEIISGHIAHAYLFIGSRGTGKTSCAKIFSVAVNCNNSVNGSPCGKCDICKEATKDSLLDVSEIDAASNNGVENIRTIKEETSLVPTMCKYRVYIIDEAHMLSTQAFNAFLKVLEEPPKHVIFILATTEPHKIPATILSRCQRFEFHRIKNEDMAKKLRYICNEENFKIDDEAIEIIVNSADGAMRDALSLLDRCVSYGGTTLNAEQVREILGITDKESVNLIYTYVKEKNTEKSLELIDNLYKSSKNMMGLCEGLLDVFRKKMAEIVSNKKIGAELEHIIASLDCLSDAYRKMSSGSDARLELEICVTKLCLRNFNIGVSKKNDVNLQKELEKCEQVEVRQKVNEEISRNRADSTIPSEVLKENKISEDSSKKMAQFDKWSSVIDNIKNKSKSLYLAIKDSKAYQDGDFILIDSNKSLLFDMLGESINKEEVRNAIQAVSGRRYRLGPYRRSEQKNKKECTDNVDKFAYKAKSLGINVKFE